MVTVDEIDKSLSLKVGDYIDNNEDGNLFSWENRLRYIRRAYGRMIRAIRTLMKQYSPNFAISKKYYSQLLTDSSMKRGLGIEILNESNNVITIEEIYELFINVKNSVSLELPAVPETEDTSIYIGTVRYITPDKYLSTKYQENDMYNTKDEYFYTILENKIYLLPILTNKQYYKVELICLEDVPELNKNDELNIPNSYIDLLVAMAALEAMEDLGRSDKVQLYTSEINNQLSILKGYADIKLQLRGSDLDG